MERFCTVRQYEGVVFKWLWGGLSGHEGLLRSGARVQSAPRATEEAQLLQWFRLHRSVPRAAPLFPTQPVPAQYHGHDSVSRNQSPPHFRRMNVAVCSGLSARGVHPSAISSGLGTLAIPHV